MAIEAAGPAAIKKYEGLAFVQDPSDVEVPAKPESALHPVNSLCSRPADSGN